MSDTPQTAEIIESSTSTESLVFRLSAKCAELERANADCRRTCAELVTDGSAVTLAQTVQRLDEQNAKLLDENVEANGRLDMQMKEIAKLREVRAAVLAYERITDTEYALGPLPDDGNYNAEFLRLLRALHATMLKS